MPLVSGGRFNWTGGMLVPVGSAYSGGGKRRTCRTVQEVPSSYYGHPVERCLKYQKHRVVKRKKPKAVTKTKTAKEKKLLKLLKSLL